MPRKTTLPEFAPAPQTPAMPRTRKEARRIDGYNEHGIPYGDTLTDLPDFSMLSMEDDVLVLDSGIEVRYLQVRGPIMGLPGQKRYIKVLLNNQICFIQTELTQDRRLNIHDPVVSQIFVSDPIKRISLAHKSDFYRDDSMPPEYHERVPAETRECVLRLMKKLMPTFLGKPGPIRESVPDKKITLLDKWRSRIDQILGK